MSESLKVYNGIEEVFGNTPLVRLKNYFPESNVFSKLEFFNPSGSIKDRAVFFMIKGALERGEIRKGDTIIVPTSGNAGLAACIASRVFDLKLICTIADTVPKEKISLLLAQGAYVICCDSEIESTGVDGYVWVAKEIAKKLENSYFINQFDNNDNLLAHYTTTGPEIWKQLGGKVDYFFAGIGSGGTLCGTGKFLKEQNKSVKIIGIDPVGGMYRKKFLNIEPNNFSYHMVSPVSDNFISPLVNFDYIDDIIEVIDREAFASCYELMQKESIRGGTSSGLAITGIKKYIENNRYIDFSDKNIVTVFPDSALRYQATLLNPIYLNENKITTQRSNFDWLEEHCIYKELIKNNKNITVLAQDSH